MMRNGTTTQTVSDADLVLAMVRSHATHSVDRIEGYVLVARALDDDGQLRAHVLMPDGQAPDLSGRILTAGQDLIATAAR